MRGLVGRRMMGVWLGLLAMLAGSLVGSAPTAAQSLRGPGAGGWSALDSGMTEYSPWIYAMAVGHDGSVYAGGSFTYASGLPVNKIARWDGSQWQPLGSGVVNDMFEIEHVTEMAVGPDGSLYVGGTFDTAGGTPANNIARWDGTSWHPLGSGLGSSYGGLSALAVSAKGTVYAGGSFQLLDGSAVTLVARWDGTSWQPLGSVDSVSSLVVGPDGSLYAGGVGYADGVATHGVARWNGTTWQALGTGISGAKWAVISDMAMGPDGSLYVGGLFDTAGGVAAANVARWDGTSWSALGSGTSGTIHALTVGNHGTLYVGGQFQAAGGVVANGVAFWTGAQWQPLDGGVNGEVHALATSADDSFVYAGGGFTKAGSAAANSVAAWRGPWRSPR